MRYAISRFGYRGLFDFGILPVGRQGLSLFSSIDRCVSIFITGRFLGFGSGPTFHHTQLSHPSPSPFFARDDPA